MKERGLLKYQNLSSACDRYIAGEDKISPTSKKQRADESKRRKSNFGTGKTLKMRSYFLNWTPLIQMYTQHRARGGSLRACVCVCERERDRVLA